MSEHGGYMKPLLASMTDLVGVLNELIAARLADGDWPYAEEAPALAPRRRRDHRLVDCRKKT